MTTARLILALILGLGLFGATALSASPGEAGHPGAERLERWAERLELSDDQRARLRATMQSHGPELRALRGEIRAEREALRALSGAFDEAQARAHAQRLGELTAQAAFLSTRMRSDIHAVLTEEQRQTLAELRERRSPRGHQAKRHGQRGPRDR